MSSYIFRTISKTELLSSSNIIKRITPLLMPCSKLHEGITKDCDQTLKGSSSAKYKIFEDKDSPIIFDIEEERKRFEIEKHRIDTTSDEFTGINLNRGVRGVFDIEDLVELIRRDKGQDICVVAVPASLKYVDYMCIVTCKSPRHMIALAEFIRKVYKRKRSKHDSIPSVEGAHSKEWIALDLGNIAVHIFSGKARAKYDIDQLWSVGPDFDSETNKPDDCITEMLEKHSLYLDNLKPKECD